MGVHGFKGSGSKGSRFYVQSSEQIKVSGFGCQEGESLNPRVKLHYIAIASSVDNGLTL
jgi:hypothetical protein